MDKQALLKPRLPERTVTLEGVGDVHVRGLSRAEQLTLADFVEDQKQGEVWMLSVAVVDPALSEEDVREWQRAAPADEFDPVINMILELSGLDITARKSGEDEVQVASGSDVRVRTGPHVGDDGGSAP